MIGINYNYYNNLDLFKWVRDYYLCLDTEGYKFTVVDDGSQIVPLPFEEVPNNWSHYVVTKDVGWNCNGARNLLMQETETKWNVNIDLDRVMCPQSMKYLRNMDLDPDKMYHFSNLPNEVLPHNPDVVENYKWLLKKQNDYSCAYNTYIITKDNFWKAKGYPELVHKGEYGGDYLFLDKFKPWNVNPNLMVFNVVHHASFDHDWKQKSMERWGRYKVGSDDGKRINYPWIKIS